MTSPLLKQSVFRLVLPLVLFLSLPGGSGAASLGSGEGTWHISAHQVTFDRERQQYTAQGDVTITRDAIRLTADRVIYDHLTADAQAQGHVQLTSDADIITGDLIFLNLQTETGTIHQGTVFTAENHFYITGNRIEKTGKTTYRADRATLTACDGPRPDWQITGRDIRVTIEGYGRVSHATLWAGGMPALYTPFLLFPVKNKRQTGLLAPRITASSRKGFEYEQPLFMALSRSSDATFYVDHMADRGTRTAAELRHVLDANNRITFYGDYLTDQKIDDGTPATADYAYAGTPQRTNAHRWWLRMKADFTPLDLWKVQMDLDHVSDADYLHEFKKGFTGYTATLSAFERDFGRDLDDYDDTTRENRLNINRRWDSCNLNMAFLWYDNVTARQTNDADTTLQTLPDISFTALPRKLGTLPLYFEMDAGGTLFHRQDTTTALLTGRRLDIHPRFFLPLHKNGLQIEPSLGLRQTLWYTDDAADIEGIRNHVSHRELYDVSLSLSTMLSRIFRLSSTADTRLKHDITPKLTYTFLPEVDQSDIPFFDDDDRIEKENTLSWSLTQRFTSRHRTIPPTDSRQKDTAPAHTYREFLWLSLSQDYHLSGTDTITQEPFSPFQLDLELSPGPAISLDTDITWSPYTGRFITHNTGLSLRDSRQNQLQVQYRYSDENNEDIDNTDDTESFYTRLDLRLTPRLHTFMTYEKNLLEGETIETTGGMVLSRSCWSMEVALSDTTDDRSIGFFVNLKGIGAFGNR